MSGAGGGEFAGTWALFRHGLRRDRWQLPSWIAFFAFMAASSAAATKNLYPSVASRVAAATTMNATAALVALYGRVYDPTSLGALALIKLTAFGAALVAIFAVFVVVRHTRAEEENGRLELVSAGVVGRSAPLAAALLLAFGASATLGLFSGLGLRAAGLASAGSCSFGLGWALTGFSFASIAAVTAQLTVSSRAARGLALGTVGAAYALRAVGDLAERGPGFASWLSPIGWSQQLRPFAGDRFWVVAFPIALVAVATPLAFVLRARRDLGSGLLSERPGPARGSLGSAAGLAWRLQRGTLLAWVAAASLMGMVLGSVAHNIRGLVETPQMRRFIALLGGEQGLVDGFLAAEVMIFGTIVAAYGVAACNRLRAEETAGHVELLLSTATTRAGFAASHFVVSLAGVAAILLSAGAAIGLGHFLATGDASQIPRVAGAAAAQVPAAWVVVGLAFALFGWSPSNAPASWVLLLAFVTLGEFGSLMGLPTWLLRVSPFAHSPRLPGGSVNAGSLVALVAVAAALGLAGFVGWRRRDLAA